MVREKSSPAVVDLVDMYGSAVVTNLSDERRVVVPTKAMIDAQFDSHGKVERKLLALVHDLNQQQEKASETITGLQKDVRSLTNIVRQLNSKLKDNERSLDIIRGKIAP